MASYRQVFKKWPIYMKSWVAQQKQNSMKFEFFSLSYWLTAKS